ncbi:MULTISPECIES: transcriptional regulator [unclassified Methanobrevibacter]|jgi:putative transcriptional regulator|uniref:transcriptional regulator n=1 Tax=unclassified Methanobrevibacter TaxID=2638681 RepID=UPI001D9DA824|nr:MULTISPECIES: transcriptional regulator [unclassified Methanobrevibacter]MBE6491358.1 transcriptional regulator [Methanobrevibacter sp.]MEE0941791.1 transcriptional regulator [Methanobrevibacter sp.]
MLTRSQLLHNIEKLLKSQGYKTSDIYDQGSFDIVARKKLLILLLKTFQNIDSINETNAHEMKQLANIFLASPIIIGERSRNGFLEEGVIYERYDIPTIGFETLKNMILYNEYPEILADRGGYFVKIDGNVIKQYREEYSLSLKDLADLAHVSRATMYKYENEIVRANTETAMILEEILNTKVTLDIDLLKQPQKEDIEFSNVDDTLDLSKLGYGVVSTNKSPFDAVAKMKTSEKQSPLMANVEKNRTEKTLKRMAVPLKDLSVVTTSEPVFIINNEKIKESIGTIPVIKSWELKEFENSKELLKMIKERKEN